MEINKLQLVNLDETDNVMFKFKNVIYKLYVQKRYKQVKGQGNVEIFRVQTFYPIYSEIEIKRIEESFNEISINEDLSFFGRR